ncbi:LPS-assembly protein LptD [Undibacterium sp. Di27W]|uniref:LPS-assembly protein LptD n=1 Tax=Undibacterium sp. Di27W TaxID=3413036 RepID=UPI003BF28112
MRRKPVLSHSPLLFPTIPAILVSVLVPAYFSQAMAQTIPSDKPEDGQVKTQPQKRPDEMSAKELLQDQKRLDKLSEKQKQDDKNAPVTIRSGSFIGSPERYIKFEHDVEVIKGGTQINADEATYRNLDDEVEAIGRVNMQRYGDCYIGDSVRMKLDANSGFVSNPVYKLLRNNAQGHAARIDFQDEERSLITRGTYSTCEGLNPDWYLESDTLNLDTGLDRGTAGKSVIYFKGVPILATPSLTFPLSGARHSGILPPTLGASSKGGPEIMVPYYFNIAPNRDLTVYPKLIARRGLQLGLEGRYLGETYSGETSVEGLLNDRVTNTNRYAVASIHQQQLLPQMVLSWNINSASDDDYPADFSRTITKTAQRLLLREANLTYFGSFWNVNLRTSNYQVLQDPVSHIDRPYDRLPQLQLHAEQHDVAGLDWSLDTILTRFWHPTMVRGDRTVINPQISLPLVQAGVFVIPKISLHATSYHLVNPEPGKESDFHRVVPTFSVDSGLVFERKTTMFDKELTQTLEPRLFYVNTPYRDQSRMPNFDSAVADFNFAQIFSENRFTGQDRIGDSNQITAALISRFIEGNGDESLKLAIGQRFYFNTQKVTLDNTVSPSRSDLLLAAIGKISTTLTGEMALQLSQTDRQSVRANYGIHWQPSPKKILNLEYRYQRNSLEQVDVSTQWPLADRWYAVGRSNYSMMDKKLVDGLLGFEYKADCWSLRFLAQRFATTSVNNTSGFSIQLELNGLARLGFGANPLDALKKNITGYQSANDR